VSDSKAITEQLLTGAAIADGLDGVATLRLGIFQEYPYLYQGRREDELTYLGTYAEKPDACVIIACDGSAIIGAATGMPLIHEDAQLLDVFAGTTFPLEEVYYVGELLFRPAYRNCGLGQRLLARLESHIRSLGRYRTLPCATVERPKNTGRVENRFHPALPHQTVHAVFPHTAFRCSSLQGMHFLPTR
jgi:GNAT superfamily N-acetyltransferase